MNQIIGEQAGMFFIDFPENSNTEKLKQDIMAVLDGSKDGVLFCCDILGGSPFRIASTLTQQISPSEVLGGTNLPMLIECAMAKDGSNFNDLVQSTLRSAKQAITNLSDELNKKSQQQAAPDTPQGESQEI